MIQQRTVRIAVLGDPDTGKTSLISTAANDTFDTRPVPTLPPTRLPLDFTPERVPVLLTDTSAKPEDARILDSVIRESDAVVVCFDPKKPATLESVRTTWYPRIQKLNPDIPIILACCKADRLADRDSSTIRERVERVARDLPNVECCLNCSSKFNKMVNDVFYYALKAVLYPLQPLYDRSDRVMRQAAVRALKRVFIIFDQDKDGTLSDAELNAFQSACFGISLSAEELRGIKQVVRAQVAGGYTDSGLTLEGFLFLQGLFIERGRLETVWQVLRKFGYNDQLRLSDELLDRVNVHLPPDQVLELSDTALAFLEQQFLLYDARGEGMLSWEQLQGLFSTAPSLPTEWQNERVNRLMVCGTYGNVHSLDGFLARWRYCCLTDPRAALAHLLYLGYEGGPGDLLVRRTRRRLDKRHKEEMPDRTTALCYVLGSAGSGKSTLLRALADRRPDAAAAGSVAGGGAAGGAGPSGASPSAPAASYQGRAAAGSPPLTALAHVSCDDGRVRALALVEVSEDVANELITAANISGKVSPSPAAGGAPAAGASLLPILGSPPPTSSSAAASPSLPSASGGTSASSGAGMIAEATPSAAPAGVGAAGSGPMGQSSGPAGGGSGLDLAHLARCDCLVIVVDSTSAESWNWAHQAMLSLCDLQGCETLPVLLLAAKDELGMCGELRQQVAADCAELALPEPLPAPADGMAHVFKQIVSAALLSPAAHIPDTPQRKARRRLHRRLTLGVAAVAGAALGGACLYYLFHDGRSGDTGEAGGKVSGGGGGGGGGGSGALSVAAPVASGFGGEVGTGTPLKLFETKSLGEQLQSLWSK